MAAKKDEREAIARRRAVEDKMIDALDLPIDLEGVMNFDGDGYKVKVTGRMNRKVDGDRIQEIATESGIAEHLGKLFRWKPEINSAAWIAADKSITNPLLGGITTTPGRASFNITRE